MPEAVRHERDISNAARLKPDFNEMDQCKPILLGLSWAGNPVKPLVSLWDRMEGAWLRTQTNEQQRDSNE